MGTHQFYNSMLWRKEAKSFVVDNPWCAWCGKQAWLGKNNKKPPVDHIVSHNGDWDRFSDQGNWQTLCPECHSQKTRLEASANRATWEPMADRYVVYGKPGTGKTVWVQKHVNTNVSFRAAVWDMDDEADRRGYGSYPRTKHQKAVLLRERAKFVDEAECAELPVYVIVENANAAYAIAKRLKAQLIPLGCPEDVRQERLRERWVTT